MTQYTNIFYSVLYFLGLRKNKPHHNPEGKTNKFTNFIKRNVFQKNDTQIEHPKLSQPRKITRFLYQKKFGYNLSPDTTFRSIEENIPEIKLNINMQIDNNKKKFKDKIIQDIGLPCVSWIYTIFILTILSVQPLYILTYIIEEENENTNFYMSNLFFNLIPPIQYILAIKYFSTDHFERTYINNNKCNPNCFPKLNKLTIILITFVFLRIIFNFLVLLTNISFIERNDGQFPNFNNFTLTSKIFIGIFLFLSWLYGSFIEFINLMCFSLIFCKHSKIINNYVKTLQNEKKGILTINDITQETIEIKYELEKSIDHFKNIFSSFTLLGAIGFGFFIDRIQNGNFTLFPWDSFIIYIIVQIIFLVVIIQVSNNIDNLSSFVREPRFIEKFLKRYTLRDIREKFNDPQLVIINMEEENASTIDWMLLQSILKENWTDFQVMGVSVSDFNLIKKGLVLVTLIVAFNTYIGN